MTLTNFPNGVSSYGIPLVGSGVIPTTGGSVFWVHSGTGLAGNDGTDKSAPLTTIDGAINKCTSNKGDVVVVLPGHSETLTASITCDIAGVTIIGLGEGTLRPQLTVNAAIDGITITADNVTLENLYFNEATNAGATANINIAAANAKLRRIHMDCGANDVDVVTITAAGELPTVEGCTVLITANGPDSWLKFEGVIDRPIVRHNVIVGSDGTNPYDDGVFDFNNQAVTNPAIYGNVFNGGNQAVTVVANGGNVVAAAYGPNTYAGSATNADNVVTISAVTLAADSIGASEIADGAIDAGAFAAGAITAAAVATGAIDADAIADNAIDAGAIAAAAITNAKFAAGAIDAAAIATNAIDADALAADALTEIENEILDAALSGHSTAATVGRSLQIVDSGTAQAAGAGSLTLAATASATSGAYIGCVVQLTGGTAAGQTAMITAYDGATKIATTAPAWAAAPDATTTYVVRPHGFAFVEAVAADAINAAAIAAASIDAATFAAGAIDAAAVADNAIDLATIAADLRREWRGSALNYNATNYLAVPVDFTNITWNTAATHEVLNVTGLVRVRIIIEGTGNVDSAGHGATVAFGDDVAQTWIAATDETEIDAGDLWYDATPTTSQDTPANAILDRIVNNLDIGYVIANEALTTGSITVHCWWEPLNSTGAVVAGAGGVLA